MENSWKNKKKKVLEVAYEDYQRHGISRSIDDGKLKYKIKYKKGIQDGITKFYYENGATKSESVYKEGVMIAEKHFDKFERTKVIVRIEHKMNDQILSKKGIPLADSYPAPQNAIETANALSVDRSFFEGYSDDQKLTYSYFVSVDSTGNVTDHRFIIADNFRIKDQVEENIQLLRFEPALKEGIPINSYIIITYRFELGESI